MWIVIEEEWLDEPNFGQAHVPIRYSIRGIYECLEFAQAELDALQQKLNAESDSDVYQTFLRLVEAPMGTQKTEVSDNVV
jgi:hypothetical protein